MNDSNDIPVHVMSLECFICHDGKDIGLPIVCAPSHLIKKKTTTEYPDMFAICQKEKEEYNTIPQLVYKIVPYNVFLCRNCRLLSEAGGTIGDLVVPSFNDRGIFNRFMQKDYHLVIYKNKWQITDRLSIISDPDNISENLLLQQFALLKGWPAKELLDAKNYKCLFYEKLADVIITCLIPLMSDNLNFALETDAKFDELLTYHMMILRIALHFVNKYPDVKKSIQKKIMLWNSNPFSIDTSYFKDVICVNFATSLSDMPLQHTNLEHFFYQIFSDKTSLSDQLEKKDIKALLYKYVYCYNLAYLVAFKSSLPECIKFIDDSKYRLSEKYTSTLLEYIKYNITGIDKNPMAYLYSLIDESSGKEIRDIPAYVLQYVNKIYMKIDIAKCEIPVMKKKEISSKYYERNSKGEYHLVTDDSKTNLEQKSVMEKQLEFSKHVGYPAVHTLRGRPLLRDKKCYYPLCGKVFDSGYHLKQHLVECSENFIDELHMEHANLQLTPALIMEQKLTKCPSKICDQKSRQFEPEELCDHFKLLGMTHFWSKNCLLPKKSHIEIKRPDIELETMFDKSELKEMYDSLELCTCCCSNPVRLKNIPCGHVCFCQNCYDKWKEMKIECPCPLCRQKVTHVDSL